MLALLYSLIIVGFPLISNVPLILGTEGTSLSIVYRALVLVLVGCVFLRWFTRGVRIAAGPPVLAIFVLWWALLARLSWDAIVQSDSLDVDFAKYSQFLIGVCIIPALAFLEIPSERVLRVARVQTEVLGSAAVVLIVYLVLTNFQEIEILTRLSTEILNPISVGYLGVSLFIASVGGLQDKFGHHRILARAGSNVVRMCVALGALTVILASGSKGPILCALVVTAIVGYVPVVAVRRHRSRIVARTAITAATAGFVAAVLFYLERETSFGVVSRIMGSLSDESTSIRIELIEGALSQFVAHPVVGDAIVERGRMYYPHNILAESLMATGVIGFVLLSIVVTVCVGAAWKLIRASHATRWVGLLYVQYLLASMFSGSLFLDGQFWALSVAVIAISSAARYNRVARAPWVATFVSAHERL